MGARSWASLASSRGHGVVMGATPSNSTAQTKSSVMEQLHVERARVLQHARAQRTPST